MRITMGALGVVGLGVSFAAAQPPAITPRGAVLLPATAAAPQDLPPVARAVAEDLPPLSTTPVLPARQPNGFDPNVIPAGGVAPPTGSTTIPSMPTTDDGSPRSRGLDRLRAALNNTAAGDQPNANSPIRSTTPAGSTVYAGRPAYRWYGWGTVTPGANPYAPTGQYPPASANWYAITGATPGAFPAPVTNGTPGMAGPEPPTYGSNQPPRNSSGGLPTTSSSPSYSIPAPDMSRPTSPDVRTPAPVVSPKPSPTPLPPPTPLSAPTTSSSAPAMPPAMPAAPAMPAVPSTPSMSTLPPPAGLNSPPAATPSMAPLPPKSPAVPALPTIPSAPANTPAPELHAGGPTAPLPSMGNVPAAPGPSAAPAQPAVLPAMSVNPGGASTPLPPPSMGIVPAAPGPSAGPAQPAVLPTMSVKPSGASTIESPIGVATQDLPPPQMLDVGIVPTVRIQPNTTPPAPLPTVPSSPAPAALPVSLTDYQLNWQPTTITTNPWNTPAKPLPASPQAAPAPLPTVNPGAPTPTPPPDWQQPESNSGSNKPIARGQIGETGPDPVVTLIKQVCNGRAADVDVRWTGSKRLTVCFECHTSAEGQKLVKDISARPELVAYRIDFCVLVK